MPATTLPLIETTDEAIEYANHLLQSHGFAGDGWAFEIEAGKRAWLGNCDYNKKKIRLCQWVIDIAPEKVSNTITHEVAHALLPGEKHSKKWAMLHRSMGGTGDRCGKIPAEMLVQAGILRWAALCVGCGILGGLWAGKPRRDFSRYRCGGCNSKEIVLCKIDEARSREIIAKLEGRFE